MHAAAGQTVAGKVALMEPASWLGAQPEKEPHGSRQPTENALRSEAPGAPMAGAPAIGASVAVVQPASDRTR
jgi:hypothetical protein